MTAFRLVQLPVPPPSAFAATGNVPLAAGCLGAAAGGGVGSLGLSIDVVPPDVTDVLGDTLLADRLAADEPAFLGLSLYLWNVDRSLALAREIKRRSPRTRILIGGPEVGPDNPFVLDQTGFDVAVTGEAEALMQPLLARLQAGAPLDDLPGVAVRNPATGRLSSFRPTGKIETPLDRFPSPYLTGALGVSPDRAVYVETVRGCKSHCTFCFYPRSSNTLRTLDAAASVEMVARLRDLGAREVVFLDPTLNHRPGFEELLDGLIALNGDRRLGFFGEVRAEGLTPKLLGKLARAGFSKLEVGLQSVNQDTLKHVKRGGRPEKVAEVARHAKAHGIDLLVDLIVGLPGDTPADVDRGIDFLCEHGLGENAQIFALSVLPGTAMRADADAGRDGLIYEPAPPYRVRGTSWMNADDIRGCLERAEERLERALDEVPRPHLVAREPGPVPDVFHFDADAPDAAQQALRAPPGAAHAALWLCAQDPFARRDLFVHALEARLAVDPHATLDVVLHPGGPFPLDLLDALRARLDRATPSYLSRCQAHRGLNLQRRLAVVLPVGKAFSPDFVAALMAEVPTFRDMGWRAAVKTPAAWGHDAPGARILDSDPDSRAWSKLSADADPEAVCFADRRLERAWVRGVLGFGEAE